MRAGRTAYAALKRDDEKVGDHGEPKPQSGPSDSRSVRSTSAKRRGEGETFGGVDVRHNTRQDWYERARSWASPDVRE